MIIPALEDLKKNNIFKDYNYVILSEDQDIIDEHEVRSTEQLCIHLNDGRILSINTFCSGSSQSSSLFVELL
jgi:hypothetical protein